MVWEVGGDGEDDNPESEVDGWTNVYEEKRDGEKGSNEKSAEDGDEDSRALFDGGDFWSPSEDWKAKSEGDVEESRKGCVDTDKKKEKYAYEEVETERNNDTDGSKDDWEYGKDELKSSFWQEDFFCRDWERLGEPEVFAFEGDGGGGDVNHSSKSDKDDTGNNSNDAPCNILCEDFWGFCQDDDAECWKK